MKTKIYVALFLLSCGFIYSSEKNREMEFHTDMFSRLSSINVAGVPYMNADYDDDDDIDNGGDDGTSDDETDEDDDAGKSFDKNDIRDIAGFSVYTSFTFATTISGIPLLAIGCYNYSLNYPGEQSLPYIITGAISLTIGGIMLTLLIGAVILVSVMFKGLRFASNKKNGVRVVFAMRIDR